MCVLKPNYRWVSWNSKQIDGAFMLMLPITLKHADTQCSHPSWLHRVLLRTSMEQAGAVPLPSSEMLRIKARTSQIFSKEGTKKSSHTMASA